MKSVLWRVYHEESIIFINPLAPNNIAVKYMKQTTLRMEEKYEKIKLSQETKYSSCRIRQSS